MTNHFALHNQDNYLQWRKEKLAPYPLNAQTLITPIQHAEQLSQRERQALQYTCQQYNFALYQLAPESSQDKRAIHQLAKTMGLTHIHANLCADADSLSAIQVSQHEGQHDYIPYSNRPLSWHTDGYYHAEEESIHGMLLHCVRPAQVGGVSRWMDHEVAYILLRDANPDFITALMHPEALTIPANIINDKVIRPERSGPVFSFNPQGCLHMRYSARQRNIRWHDDPLTQAAKQFLQQLWQDDDSPYIVRHSLQAGEGLLCNNVLHCRSAFQDAVEQEKKRLLYRGRYLSRVDTTTCFDGTGNNKFNDRAGVSGDSPSNVVIFTGVDHYFSEKIN